MRKRSRIYMHAYDRLSDKECIDLYQAKRDKEAFGVIFERYITSTYRFVYSRVGNSVWAEEIVSNTFFVLMEALLKFNKQSQIKTFIFGIANNMIKQFWCRKYKRFEVNFDENQIITEPLVEEEEEEVFESNLVSILPQILKQLPKRYADVLTERFINEKSIKDTACYLKLSEENVRVIQFRALKKASEIGNKLL